MNGLTEITNTNPTMNATLNWHILYTKYKTELKLAQDLERKGYETFCPHYSDSRKWNLLEKEHPGILFSSWVFVRCAPAQLDMIKYSYTKVKVLYLLNKPAIVSEEEISQIRYVLGHYTEVQPLKTGIGSLQTAISTSDETISFSLPSLGFALLVKKENERSEAYQPSLEKSDGLEADFSNRRWNTRNLLKKIPSLIHGKLLKPTS